MDHTIEERASTRLSAPRLDRATGAPEARPPEVVFVLPPNLEQFGEIRIPSGILILASLAQQAGYSTDFLIASSPGTQKTCPSEFVFDPEDRGSGVLEAFIKALVVKIEQSLAAQKRTVIAISCFSSALYIPTMLLGAYLRHRFPDLPILVGGYHPTIDPESLLEPVGTQAGVVRESGQWQQIMGAYAGELDAATAAIVGGNDFVFDYVFRGRAEKSVLGVLAELNQSWQRRSAPRILEPRPLDNDEVRQFRYSREVLSALAGPPGELDEPGLPRRFDLCFSFGCPHSCHFCINSMLGPGWQGMDVEHALDVLKFLHHEHQVAQFSVLDANFAVSTQWRQSFWDGLAEQPFAEQIQLDIQTSVMDFDLTDFAILDRPGITVQVGVESCSADMLLRMNKTRDPGLYKKRLRRLIESMAPHVDMIGLLMILGYPGETRETLTESLEFLFADCDILAYPNVAILPQLYLPLKGTEAANRTAQYEQEFGFKPNTCAWWQGEASSIFAGLRPSGELSLGECARLNSLIVNYYFGDVPTGPLATPTLTVKTKLRKRRFVTRLRRELLAVSG